MTQSIKFPGLGQASGIIGVLFIIGLVTFKYVDVQLGWGAIKLSIFFAVAYAFCGLLGILKKLLK